jgi:Plasmid replication region DNA-binding N-term
MKTPVTAYGTTRERGPTLSYAEIERAARDVMASGKRPSARLVYEALGRRGSPNHINASLERFWRDQAAMSEGNPVALSRLPPELADAAVAQWEQALRLAQQKSSFDDNAARAHLEQLRRDTDARARSVELREKEWDMAARVRERALTDAREHINVLMKALSTDRAELHARDARIVDLESQLEGCRQQLATVISRAALKHRIGAAKRKPKNPAKLKSGTKAAAKKRARTKNARKSAKRLIRRRRR